MIAKAVDECVRWNVPDANETFMVPEEMDWMWDDRYCCVEAGASRADFHKLKKVSANFASISPILPQS